MMIRKTNKSRRNALRPWMRAVALLLAGCLLLPPSVLAAGTVVDPTPEAKNRVINLLFRDSPLDMVLNLYGELTGRTMIKSPGINATITLQGRGELTVTEAMQAIESALAMNNVALVPMGDKFLRVVQPTAVRQEGMPIIKEIPEDPFPDADQILSLIINLRHTEIAEVQPILQQMIHGYGKLQPFERTNSIMVTDTSANLQRIMEILEYIDRPVELREDIFVRQLRYAEAAQVATRLNEFIQDQQQEEQRPRVTPPSNIPTPPGVIRAPRPDGSPGTAEGATAADLAERGIIQGKVKIVADERINTLFIISRPANFTFFDRIIDVLDQPIDPEVIVRVIALEYAEAEEVAGILNEFIGAASADAPASARLAAGAAGETPGGGRAEALRDFAAAMGRTPAATTPAPGADTDASRIGRLSANTKILSDKRSNALLLMGRRSDIAALEEIIEQLDIMLGQVLIEAVIVEISLGKNVETGVDWLQRTLMAYNEQTAGPAGGVVIREPVAAFGGGSRTGDIVSDIATARNSLLDGVPPTGAGSLTYFLTLFDLNLDVVVRLAASSRDARILSTPVILTTDNTEAKIIVGESRPVVTSTSASTVGDRQVSNYQFRDIGINLTVTPRINPQRFVVMEIAQSADNVGGFEIIDGNRVPIITKREMSANIAVRSHSTIVLGGLVNTDRTVSTSKVPLLGDIPILGRLFRSDTVEDARTELLVLITPYVMMTPEEAREESARLHSNSYSSRTEWHTGWSGSEFATEATVGQDYRGRKKGHSVTTVSPHNPDLLPIPKLPPEPTTDEAAPDEPGTVHVIEWHESTRIPEPVLDPTPEPEGIPEEAEPAAPAEEEIMAPPSEDTVPVAAPVVVPVPDPYQPVPLR